MIFNLEFYGHLKYHIVVGVEYVKFRYVKSQKMYLSVIPFQEATTGYAAENEGANLKEGNGGQGIKDPTQEAGGGNFQDESKDTSSNSCKTDLGSSQY